MLRPIVIPLTFIVATTGFFVALYAEASIPFFPTSLQDEVLKCSEGPHADYEVSVLDEFEADWFAGELRSLREKPLYPVRDASSDTLRFTWLRSFHAPVVVRTDRLREGGVRLVAKRSADMDGCTLQGKDCAVTRMLTSAEVARLDAVRGQAYETAPQACRGGVDGARWIVESSKDGEYRFAQRWSPETGSVREMGIAMLDLTGWDFEVY